jgi:hypothetical protein
MGLRSRAEATAWTASETAQDAEARLADLAFELEERVLWRGTDAARAGALRAAASMEPLQRLIDTKLVWPVTDAYREGGVAMRTALATAAVVAAVGAGSAGVMIGKGGEGASGDGARLASSSLPVTRSAGVGEQPTLRGVAPDFEQGQDGAAPAVTAKLTASQAVPPAPAAPVASAPPDEVAWRFARAFVRYEIGDADRETAATFAAVAQDPLAKALGEEPPRLPASADVPKAEVLNVVLADREGEEVEASVSLLRMQAASELRLTLRHTPAGWQVAEVLG